MWPFSTFTSSIAFSACYQIQRSCITLDDRTAYNISQSGIYTRLNSTGNPWISFTRYTALTTVRYQSSNLYCTPRRRIKNKINEIKYNNTAHIKYTSKKKNVTGIYSFTINVNIPTWKNDSLVRKLKRPIWVSSSSWIARTRFDGENLTNTEQTRSQDNWQ